MRDKLHGVMHDTSIDKTAYRLPRDADYLTKGALYGKALSSSAPEQMVFERKYWLMRTSAAEGGDSMVAILQAVGAGLSISAVFAGVVAIMRKFISLAEEEEEQLYGTKLEVDATELEPDEVVQLSGLEDDDGQSDEGSDARPPLPESPQAPPGGADDDDDLL
ncbi:hypothetical protein JKP88DRAFT_235014 [Tribonema minus]|uniref:Uncharacterized protein n=1 Tax=Tribonema minus TaxID=303371 RepID=A0A836CLF4_9STRA|nr:hypothetical protein JKP88DRAFT_235014 [Tribonema minus]